MVTPSQMQEKLLNLLNNLATANEEYLSKYIEYINSYNKNKVEYSKAFLENKIKLGKATVAEIEAKTILDTQKYKLDADIKEAHYKAHKEKLEAIKTEIDTIRSLLSFSKSEIERS
ncbi:hypothetical protein SAMN05661008_01510 [Alkalithermobacter thermoalcaliphilus JW-YL-7 = DSM 7308]|uniref:Uncharacterized protein n=1 Tax=Alkalithermobacter thermoalcaliphilus JW-YL-7 = DSM 7308 TaxID=1121328 RepID=A0A150FSM0_CLOPD|nr:hypothetical protein JWYL7_1105 [[Clostridium] paradoxum JW-YL-7 = DSM 7308]SHL13027.1 hypothetical protein SAMN05661008_01510 [[Clostridium] paradoxum JW-YL-7 = DSM 7308]